MFCELSFSSCRRRIISSLLKKRERRKSSVSLARSRCLFLLSTQCSGFCPNLSAPFLTLQYELQPQQLLVCTPSAVAHFDRSFHNHQNLSIAPAIVTLDAAIITAFSLLFSYFICKWSPLLTAVFPTTAWRLDELFFCTFYTSFCAQHISEFFLWSKVHTFKIGGKIAEITRLRVLFVQEHACHHDEKDEIRRPRCARGKDTQLVSS